MNRGFFKLTGLLMSLAMLSISPVLSAQTHFADAAQAANRFVIAVARQDTAALTSILGDDYRFLLPIDRIRAGVVDQFLDAWARYHTLLPVSDKVRMLTVGENGWTLPVPIVHEAEGWRFDS